jgi:hypothetical protein
MIRNKLNKLIITLFVVSTFSISVFATDGYFRHGYGIKYSALAGSGVAVSLSSLGAISNPDGIVSFDTDCHGTAIGVSISTCLLILYAC